MALLNNESYASKLAGIFRKENEFKGSLKFKDELLRGAKLSKYTKRLRECRALRTTKKQIKIGDPIWLTANKEILKNIPKELDHALLKLLSKGHKDIKPLDYNIEKAVDIFSLTVNNYNLALYPTVTTFKDYVRDVVKILPLKYDLENDLSKYYIERSFLIARSTIEYTQEWFSKEERRQYNLREMKRHAKGIHAVAEFLSAAAKYPPPPSYLADGTTIRKYKEGIDKIRKENEERRKEDVKKKHALLEDLSKNKIKDYLGDCFLFCMDCLFFTDIVHKDGINVVPQHIIVELINNIRQEIKEELDKK